MKRRSGPRHGGNRYDAMLDGRATLTDDLARLVAAARGPATPEESDDIEGGLVSAAAVFAAAECAETTPGPSPDAATAGAPARRWRPSRLAKVASAATGLLVVSGAAYALTTVAAPNLSPDSSSAVAGGHATASASSAGPDTAFRTESTAGTSSSAGRASAGGSSAAGQASAAPTGAAAPSLAGLCRAWMSRPSGAGNADGNTAFSVLIAAAGGSDNVSSYCTTVVLPAASPAGATTPAAQSSTPASSAASTTHPTHPTHPSRPALPTQANGQPSSVPAR